MPMRAPRCLGSAAMVVIVSDAAWNSRPYTDALFWSATSATLGGEREHDVEVPDRQQVGLALGQPGARGRVLATRTMPVGAAVILDPPVPAVGAGLHVTTHDGGAAGLDRRHDPTPPVTAITA